MDEIELVKEKAQEFAESAFQKYLDHKQVAETISEELRYFYSDEHKAIFLSEVHTCVVTQLTEHELVCRNPQGCYISKNLKDAIFFTKQEHNELMRKQEKEEMFMKANRGVTITTGNNAFVNLGKIEKSIVANAIQLEQAGKEDISKYLKDLADAIAVCSELSQDQRQEYLEHVEVLTEEALKENNNRMKPSILKTIVKNGLGSLQHFSSLASIWSAVGPKLIEYFSIG